ncbi:MAG TPA: DUF5666 domain-containing protein [Verrucomicrobiae bacterium]|nr:DUF5666 domain-containing protein [Verrucomicrobiae bacterium]
MSTRWWNRVAGTALVIAGLMLVVNVLAEDAPAASTGTTSGQYGDQIVGNTDAQRPLVFGRVSAINTWDQTLTVKGFLLDKTFKINSDTRIGVEDKTVATLDDLKIGDRVQVVYQKQGRSLVADRITDTSWDNTRSGSPSR